MATVGFPDGIEGRHTGHHRNIVVSALPLLGLAAILAAALLGLFGGTGANEFHSDGPEGELSARVPSTLRSGIFFEMEIAVQARRDIKEATIAVSPELWRNVTINTVLPQASKETFKGGLLHLGYGLLRAGESIEIRIDGQINPNLFLGNHGQIAFFNGNRKLLTIPVHFTVLP